MEFITKIVSLSTVLLFYISFNEASMPPPSSRSGKSERKELYKQHFARDFIQRDETNKVYQTKSDSMQLYAIAAKRLVIVQKKAGTMSWDREYELSVNPKAKRYGKFNKFVTETVSYRRLKIRSEDNNYYICAKNTGEIVFKEDGKKSKIGKDGSTKSSSRRNKARKRCLFNWSFTNQMHIKLSITLAQRKWFLTVKDGVVTLTQDEGSTELEKSFIWLPASGKNKYSTVDNLRRVTSNNQREFEYGLPAPVCERKKDIKCEMKKEKTALLKIKNSICKTDLESLKQKNTLLEVEIMELKRLIKLKESTERNKID